MMSNGVIVKSIVLKASPEKVWRFLTEKDKLARWFHETNRDLTEPSAFHYLRHDDEAEERKLMWGDILEVVPHSKLVHTFTHQALAGVVTTVTWELTPIEDGTQLTMTHEGLKSLAALSGHDSGWDQHLTRLRVVVN
ncbi:MAG: hypothetical protein ACJAYU_002890 [Bradymonadia bacterium]|jgi:uncharacterized protein YndB with AHSA1/START domain